MAVLSGQGIFGISWNDFASYEFEDPPCVSVFSWYFQLPLLWAGDTTCCYGLSKQLSRERGLSISVKVVKASEVEGFFGARKPIFLGICRLHFLSEDPWRIVIFAFIYFISCLFFFHVISFFYISYLIPTHPSKTNKTCRVLLEK